MTFVKEMSPSASEPDPNEPTLYDPSEEKTEEIEEEADEEELILDIPQELARQLLEVALHLGLSPSVVASRAIDMICEEVGLVEDDDLSSGTLIQKYQTRLDLLHTLNFDVESETEDDEETSEGWDAVDRIIETGEQSR
jgi:hypothetical protein